MSKHRRDERVSRGTSSPLNLAHSPNAESCLDDQPTHISIRPRVVLYDVAVPRKGVDDGDDDVEEDGEDVSPAEDGGEEEGEQGRGGDGEEEVAGGAGRGEGV